MVASVETTRVATERGSVRRADGRVYRTRFPGHTFVLCRLA